MGTAISCLIKSPLRSDDIIDNNGLDAITLTALRLAEGEALRGPLCVQSE